MKRIFAATGFSLMLVTQTLAHQGTVYVMGTITDNTCAVSPDSQNLTVTMGDVASKQFAVAGEGSRYEAFTINLEKCSSAISTVSLHFDGTPDGKNSSLLALTGGTGYATGVGVAIYDQNKTPIPLGSESGKLPLTAGQTTAALKFYARYIADGDTVSTGDANASATFVLTYE